MFSEILEPRRLMAVDVSVDSFRLTITGTKESESIDVRFDIAKDAKRRPVVVGYVVRVDGEIVKRLPVDEATSIVINGGGGRDVITGPAFVTGRHRIGQTTRKHLRMPPMFVDGGSGNDRIVGGAGDDHLKGGPGNDVLIDESGRNTLDGGTGSDRIDVRDRVDGKLQKPGRTSGFSRDTLDGGSGDDGRDLLSLDADDTCYALLNDRMRVGTEKFRAPRFRYTPTEPVVGSGTITLNLGGLTLTNAGGQAFQGGLTLSGGTGVLVPQTPDDADELAEA